MADVNDLNVHDVVSRDDVDFRPATFGTQLTVVRFFVGVHGPFELRYKKGEGTVDRIKQDMDNQVVTLRRITQGM